MILRPPRSTLLTHSFPTRRSSDRFIWPLARVSSALLIVPVLGSGRVSARIRLTLALLVTLLIVPTLPPPPLAELFISVWWSTLLREIAIGVLMCFTLLLVFDAVLLCGTQLASTSRLSLSTPPHTLPG